MNKKILFLISFLACGYFSLTAQVITKLSDIAAFSDFQTNGRAADDWFGVSASTSGDIMVVGASRQDFDATGANFATNAGAAYVFSKNQGGANNWGLVKKLVGSGTNGRMASDWFGTSVSTNGDIIVVGATGQDYDATGANLVNNAGAAYVFSKDQGGTNNWGLVKKLVGSGTNGRVAGDLFGSVSINGGNIVVGAYGQDYDATGANFVSDAGAAYVFSKNQGGTNNWGLVKKLVGSGTNGRVAGDYFGRSVSINGGNIVVGASGQGYDATGANFATNAGAAYVFSKDQGGTNNWGLVKKLVGSGTNGRVAGDYFGFSVATSGDNIVVGAYAQDYDATGANFVSDAGAAYVFSKNQGGTNNWGLVKKLVGSGTNGRVAGDYFGRSVSINGGNIVVGAYAQDYDATGANFATNAGAAYVFSKDQGGTNNWGLVKKLVGSGTNGRVAGDEFGFSVSTSGDIMVVGAYGQDYDATGTNLVSDAGAAYVFSKDQGGTNNWGLVKKLVGSGTNGRVAGDRFGFSVATSGDNIVVGATGQDYDATGANLVNSAGAAYVFSKNQGGTNNWGLVKKLVGSGTNGRVADDWFGVSASISGDNIVVGAFFQDYDAFGTNSLGNAGAAYVFSKNQGGANNWGLVKKLVGSGTNGRVSGDVFGRSVSINNTNIVVGATGQDYDATGANFASDAGAAYMFSQNQGGTNNWGLVKKLAGSGTNGRVAGDEFGVFVSINGDSIAVGAFGQDYDATGANFVSDAGAAYVFSKNQGGTNNWGQVKKLVGSGTNGRVAGDVFGRSVSINGGNIVVGASGQGYDADGANFVSGAGRATIFETLESLSCTAGMWDYTPDATTDSLDATVYSGTCVLNAGSGVDVKSLTINSGAILNLAATADQLYIYGNLTNNGTTTGNGVITLSGATAQSIFGNGVTHRLTLNNSNGASITDSLKVSDVYTHTAGTLTTNGKLKLVATNGTTYGKIAGAGSGDISGTVVAEYMIPAGSGKWRSISSPLNGVTFADIEDDININYGTPNFSYTNVWQFDETLGGGAGAWQPVTANSQTMDDNGFSVYLFDDDVASAKTIDVTGTYSKGDYTSAALSRTGSLTDTTGWHILRNPWPSNYNHNSTITNLQSNTIYVYEGNIARDWNGTTGSLSNGVVPPFHGVYVQINSNNNTLTFPAANRVVDNSANYLDKNGLNSYVALKVTNPNTGKWDETRAYQDDRAENGHDFWDAAKKYNGTGEFNIYTMVEDKATSINMFKVIPQGGLSIPVMYRGTGQQSTVQMQFTTDNIPADVEVELEDLETNTIHKVQDGIYTFNDNNTEGKINQRFVLHYRKKSNTNTSVVDQNTASDVVYVSNPDLGNTLHINFMQQGNYTVKVTDLLGRNLVTETIVTNGGTIENLNVPVASAGYYIVLINSKAVNKSIKVFINK